MRRDSSTPSPRSLKKLKSVHRASAFTFPSLTPTSTCRGSWRVSSARKSGWLPGLVRLAANPAVAPRGRPPKPMEGWGVGPERQLHYRNVQVPLSRCLAAFRALWQGVDYKAGRTSGDECQGLTWLGFTGKLQMWNRSTQPRRGN